MSRGRRSASYFEIYSSRICKRSSLCEFIVFFASYLMRHEPYDRTARAATLLIAQEACSVKTAVPGSVATRAPLAPLPLRLNPLLQCLDFLLSCGESDVSKPRLTSAPSASVAPRSLMPSMALKSPRGISSPLKTGNAGRAAPLGACLVCARGFKHQAGFDGLKVEQAGHEADLGTGRCPARSLPRQSGPARSGCRARPCRHGAGCRRRPAALGAPVRPAVLFHKHST